MEKKCKEYTHEIPPISMWFQRAHDQSLAQSCVKEKKWGI